MPKAKWPQNRPAKGGGDRPGKHGPKNGGGDRPAQPFTADSPTRVTDASMFNLDPQEIAYRKAQIAAKRDERRIREGRTAAIEDMLFGVAMGEPTKSSEQVSAATRLHAIYNGQPASNVNMKANVTRSIAELSDDELIALAGPEPNTSGTDEADGGQE